MKITIDLPYSIDDILKEREDIALNVNKRELNKNFKKMLEEYVTELVYSAYDCRDMHEGIFEKLVNDNIIETE